MSGPDRMRERLRELGRSADRELAPELDARIVEHVRLHGPKVVRRSRQRRAVLRASAVVVPFALGVFGWRAWEGSERGEQSQRARATSVESTGAARVEERARTPLDALAQTPTSQCAQRSVESSTFVGSASGRRVLDLADRGRAVLERDAEAKLDASDPCRLALQLERGRVTVHAKNLMGGELHVKAAGADVVVHGTTFAVERVADDVTVAVAEGAVAVEREGRAVAPLVRGGQRLQVAIKQAPVLLALSEAETLQLRAAVEEIVVPQPRAAADEAASHATLEESVAARTQDAVGRARRSRSASERSVRFRASQARSVRFGTRDDSGSDASSEDSESARSDGAARAIGSSAWQRALADSSSISQPAAAPGESSNASTSVRPSAEPAAVSSPASPREPSRSEAAPSAEASARPEVATPAALASRDAETPARAETASELVARADALWRRGSRDDARTLYRRAGTASGPTAQAAWLALARRELAAGRASAARAALDGYSARFPSGALSEEAAGIEFRIALLEHDDALAERLAKRLCERHPNSPAAQAAARWLRTRGRTP